jgi:hypothetical protein
VALCIRPFGLFIAGDEDCRARDEAARAATLASREERAWARAAGSGSDGVTAFEGVVGSVLGSVGGVLDTLVGSDPVSQLLEGGALGGATQPTPIDGVVIVVALGGVAALVLWSQRKGGK